MCQKLDTVRKRLIISWCLYDWANSAFPTVIITFVFATYFTNSVAFDVITGTAYWGYTISLSSLIVALTAPMFGAVADNSGKDRLWLGSFTLICILCCCVLWFVEPNWSYAFLALLLVGVANFAFEISMVFYNAMLPKLVSGSHLGRISGLGWGLGYFGGLLCLSLTLFGLVSPEIPWFGLDKTTAEHVRAAPILVSIWYTVFSIPLFIFFTEKRDCSFTFNSAIKRGYSDLKYTILRIRKRFNIVRFLIARMLYTDGLNTLFAFGGIYAAGSFGMEMKEIIFFAIGLNLTAGLGAMIFGWVDDCIGPKKTIMISITGLIVLGAILLIIETKTNFWIFGLSLGIFVGPAQAASRSLMAKLTPSKEARKLFGLYAFSGKATAFLGPALLGFVSVIFDSQRAGMGMILVFFVFGMILLNGVVENSSKA